MAVYENNLPLVSDKIRNFPGDVSTKNWPYLNTTINVDHLFSLDTATTNNGCHRTSTYFVTTDPTTSSTQYAVYCKNDTGPRPQLWVRPPSNGTPVQLTAGVAANVPTASTNGCTYLPGGVLLQWGTTGGLVSNGAVIGFPVAFSAAPYSVVITLGDGVTLGNAHWVAAKTTLNWTLGSLSGANTFYWTAIGPA
jgi:hypothetical protein